jgi:hypothetical protein
MTVKCARTTNHENIDDQTQYRHRPRFLSGRRARCATAAVLLPAVSAVTLLFSGGTASAMTTPLSTYPTSECYANGTVVADKPTVNSNGQYVYFTPILDVWSNGQWVPIRVGQIQGAYEPGPDGGEIGTWLAVSPITFYVRPHHYYRVVDSISVPGSGTIDYTTWPMQDRVGSRYYCYTN